MSISGVNSNQSVWQWQNQANASASATTAESSATDAIANSGSVSAGNMAAFFQSFSTDLQSMLSQAGSAGSTATAAASTAQTSQTAANQPVASPHHHHHHSEGGGSGSMQGAANQVTAQIGQDLGGSGSLTASGISNSASVFAADVMQAMQAYGSTASATTSTALVA